MTDIVKFEFPVFSEDYINTGKVSSEFKKYLHQLGIDPKIIRKIAIASFEAEVNLVIHSVGGKLLLEVTSDIIYLHSVDFGPGISDINLALTPGFSTANAKAREMGFGAGMGLPNMKNNSDSFYIESSPKGTYIKMSYNI